MFSTQTADRQESCRCIRMGSRNALVAAITFLLVPIVDAQEAWEFSPYKIRVWTALHSSAALTPNYKRALYETIEQRAESEMPAVWDLSVESPPGLLATAMSVDLELVQRESIEQVAADVLEGDKLMLLSIAATPRGFQVQAREFDCRTRTLGPVIERSTRQLEMLDTECFSAILAAFGALVRIEQGEGRHLTVRLRAGGLITDLNSPAYIDVGDILQPILRRNDRVGQPSSIHVVPWTYLQVERRVEINPNLLEVYVHSSWRSPIRGGTSARREQYGMVIRPTASLTVLQVEAKPMRRGDTPYPLEGMEIYAKRPSTEAPPTTAEEKQAAEKRNPPEFLGRTDWRGALSISRGDLPLRLLYIKSGGQLLARLPIVPGLNTTQIAQVADDDPRLQAEGYIQGFNGEVMDVVAQRQMHAARIRKRLAAGEVEEAGQILERFRELPSRNDMVRELDQQQTRQRTSTNRMVQQRIERLYADTRQMLSKYLDPNLDGALLNEVNGARSSGE